MADHNEGWVMVPREAVLNVARQAEALKRDCGMDPESAQAIRNGQYMAISYALRELLVAAPAAPVATAFPWENFPSFLIDKCEGDTITEEGLQRAAAEMLNDSKYMKAAAPAVEVDEAKTCTWSYDSDSDSWDTGCGEKHQFTSGGPADNSHRYCPYCARSLRAAALGREGS